MKLQIALFLSVILFSFGVSAQPPQNKSKIPKDAGQSALNLRIIDVLQQTANEAKGWENVKVSSKIQAQIADLLWDYDAISAENYLVRAWDKAKQVTESDEKPNRFRNESNRVEVSREVLLVARKRQPELAEKWLKELADLAEEDFDKRTKGLFDDRTARSAVLLQMALQTVETDIDAAASLAIASLTDGISFGFQSVLIKIQEKNPNLAAQVFRAALQRINSNGIKDANEIEILMSYLYTPGMVSTTADSASSNQRVISIPRNRTKMTSAAELYPALAQEFLPAAARAILRMPFSVGDENPQDAARQQFGVINSLLYRLGNSSTELANALRDRLAAITANANFTPTPPTSPSDRTPIKSGESRDDYLKRVLDEVLEKAEKMSNPLQRDIFIAQAVLRTDAEQFEKAKNVAENIDDKELRGQIVDFLIYKASLNLIKNRRLDEAYKLQQKDNEARHRAVILIVGGQKFVGQKDFVSARDWLLEAGKLFEKNKTADEDWINIGLGLANAYAEIDKIEALKILDSSIKLTKEDSKNYNRDHAPLAIGFSGFTFSDFTLDTKNFSLDSAVKSFPKENFEDVLLSLNGAVNPQAKGQGILVLSRKHLEKPKRNSK